ncbi:unnamed protein product, partial [Staurois parvus]
ECQEWTQHWWWDSPAVWAAVPGLTSGCSQQPEAHFCSLPTPGADYSRNGLSTGGGTHLPCGLQYQG